ncbi:MAG: HlyD family efflux transporter periplasmic adaptor subunit [Planctomycetaceae bacterium]|nr:HlyD family efflux transporter periplasmic adaptor subunit [Planctomycetaceae bacterium]
MQISADLSTVEFTRTRLVLREGLKLVPQRYGDETFWHLEVPGTSSWFRIGHAEYVFVSLLDGRTSFAQALAIASQTLGENALSRNDALGVYTWLLENGLAAFAKDSGPEAVAGGNGQAAAHRFLQKLNPFWIRLPLGNPQPLLKWLTPRCRFLFSLPATLIMLGCVLVALVTLKSDWSRFSAAAEGVFAPDNWLWLMAAWILLKVVHELSHAIVCTRYGGEVRQMGIVLAFFVPMAYVDASSSWSFRSRFQRIHCALAGMHTELFVAALAVLGWKYVQSPNAAHLLHNVILMASVSTLLFNLNPLMRFDGYYVLSDLLQIPNLASSASEVLREETKRFVFGITARRPTHTGTQRWILLTYGILAASWRLLISLTLMIGASVMFHGAGLLLSVPAVIAWFGLPCWQVARSILETRRTNPTRLFRGAVVLGGIVLAATGLYFAPAPIIATAPAIVDFEDGEVVRATTSGFVAAVHVQNEQHVQAGDLLIELRNDEVASKYRDLELQIHQEEIRQQQANRLHDSGALSIATANLKSLRKQLDEARRDFEGLQIRAQTSGRIIARGLDRLPERYAPEGQHLLTVGTEGRKRILASVSQQDLETTTARIGQKVGIRIGTRSRITGTLERINPRASRNLRDPALAATNGGRLAVMRNQDADRDDHDSEMRLTEERFDATILLDGTDAAHIHCGERAVVALGMADASLGQWAVRGSRHWVRDQLEAALRGD